MKDKKKLDVIPFGRQLIETGDLDPLYIALWKARLPRPQLCRWLVAYWCYYHAGLCCELSEKRDFFGGLLKVAEGGTAYPRGTERRHFRGALAITSIEAMQEQFASAEDLVEWLTEAGPSARKIMKQVKQLRGFGKWVSWKVADMVERLDLGPVEFVGTDVSLMFDSSLKGAKEVARRHADPEDPLRSAHRFLLRKLGALLSPPRFERRINVQETETVFCKWKSHLGGHYPLGKDSHEIRVGLLRYEKCSTSQKLLRGLREGTPGG